MISDSEFMEKCSAMLDRLAHEVELLDDVLDIDFDGEILRIVIPERNKSEPEKGELTVNSPMLKFCDKTMPQVDNDQISQSRPHRIY